MLGLILCSFYSSHSFFAVLTLGLEQRDYTFSELNQVANICVLILNGAAERSVEFEVTTTRGDASGKEFSFGNV